MIDVGLLAELDVERAPVMDLELVGVAVLRGEVAREPDGGIHVDGVHASRARPQREQAR